MTRLSPSAQATVSQFAASMDLTALEASDGSYSFDFERSGRLSITGTQDGTVLVTLSRRILLEGLRGLAPFVRQAGYDRMTNTLVHAGLSSDNRPVLALRFDGQAFNVPALQAGFEDLSDRFSAAGY